MTIPISTSVDLLQMLLDVALKSAVIMLATLLLSLLLRRASAATRHYIWTLALSSLLALPILTVLLPGWRMPLLPSLHTPVDLSVRSMTPAADLKSDFAIKESVNERFSGALAPGGPITASPRDRERNETPALLGSPLVSNRMNSVAALSGYWPQLVLVFWLTGVLVALARLALGVIRVGRVVRRAVYVIDYSWGALVRRLTGQLQLPEHIALLRSEYVTMPITWGIWNPVVLLPEEADEWTAEWRKIVMVHELAHIKRRDCLTQLLAQVACALYWFNPLVWFAARQLRIEREIACDNYVLEVGTRASDYAYYLVEIAKAVGIGGWTSPVAAGIACSQLESRVRSILDPTIRRKNLTRRVTFFILFTAACLVTPLAALQPWTTAASQQKREVADTSPAPLQKVQSNIVNPAQQQEPQEPQKDQLKQDEQLIDTQGQQEESAETDLTESQEQDEGTATQDPRQDPGKGAGGSSGLTAEHFIEMKRHDVTPEFVESMRKLGFDALSIQDLINLRMHGITEEFIKEARNWSNEKLTVKDLVQLRISGVTPEYIREMKKAGYDLPIKSLSNMRMFGVTPEFIETMRKLGYTNLTAEQLTGLAMHGVSESYVKEMREAGYDKLPVEQLTRMRMFGVTPGYMKQMRDAGFDKLSVEELTRMAMHGVTPDYIKEMREAGFDKLSAEELTRMRMHGVTADYVKKMRAAGLKNVSANQLLQMKMHGIDQILIKN